MLFALGFQDDTVPKVSNEASRFRVFPSTKVKLPPATTESPNVARANTVSFAPGFQLESSAPVERMWERFWRSTPATAVK